MTTTTKKAGVNPGESTGQELVDIAFTFPAELWELVKEESRDQLVTTDSIIEAALRERYARPEGTSLMFFSERTVRYVRECCAIVGIDADEWAEGWIALGHLEPGLDGEYDVTNGGIAVDLVEEYNDADGQPRTPEVKEALYEKFREVAFRYQQELKQEADASEEGGAE